MPDTSPRPFIFVLMPFDKTFDDIYLLGIKEACSLAGAYAERVDEQQYDGTILTRIYNQIAKADIVVADMSGRNANVFYETGYAHALDKRVILLTQNESDIPFDLKQHPHIIYGGKITQLRDELRKRVVWALENPRKQLEKQAGHLRFSMNGVPFSSEPTFDVSLEHSREGQYVRVLVDAENPVDTDIRKTTFQLALITPADFFGTIPDHRERLVLGARIPDTDKCILVVDKVHEVLPGSWKTSIRIDVATNILNGGGTYPFTLRVISDGLPQEYPFHVKIIKIG